MLRPMGLSLVFLFLQTAEAGDLLETVSRKLNKASSSKMAVKKTVYNAFTEETKSYEGKLQVSHKSLRLDYVTPEKSMILIGETEIWVVNYDVNSKDKISQILHVNTKKSKAHQLLLSLLAGDGLLKKFKVLKKTLGPKQSMFKLKPTMTIEEIESLEVLIDGEKNNIKKVTYWDESENKTEYELSEVSYQTSKVDKKDFQFKPPKGVKVEELTDTDAK
ncbi:MAG: outer membrane lipoprotein carrier protein LolA [Pseudomonadota bacterium]|nr:outer membrane lipoprotein carrier protein LolA [Pseudomonadota bacterium]